MITLTASVCINATTPLVWEHLARIEEIQLWSELVLSARISGALSQGVGAERICELAGSRTIRERWIAWDEGRSFEYEGYDIPLVRRARNRWSVAAHGDRTLLTSEASVVLRGGLAGALLEPLMAPVMRRTAAGTLAAFKYLVEHGQPYPGRASELPPAPAVCV